MRDDLHQYYTAKDAYYDQSRAHETASKALAIFAVERGDVRRSIIAAVNFGRDTDCLAAAAGGLAGALQGIDRVPADWISKVEEVTKANPYTNSQLTMKQTADGMYAAFKNRIAKMKKYVAFTEANG
jgi:ADP-ribosylglycohydrolase